MFAPGRLRCRSESAGATVDAAVEAFDHAICLGMAWWRQPMFDGGIGTCNVELVHAARLLVFRGESVGELRTVVGQDLADLDRRPLLQAVQEVDAAGIGHVAVDVHKDPARGAVDGHEQVATRRLVRHLRQVLDVDVDEAWLVVLEGLLRGDLLSLGRRDQVRQARHALTLEQARDARTRDGRVDVLLGNEQQVVEGQVERLAQRKHDRLLRLAQGRVQGVGPVRTVIDVVPLEPLCGGRPRDVEYLGSLPIGQAGILDLLVDFWGSAGLRMDACDHAAVCSS